MGTPNDQLPQFNNKSSVIQTFFVHLQVPKSLCGFLTVLIVSLVHLSLVVTITTFFIFNISVSTLGSA
jgi:hypothetical protein